jgi:hypothetical protein
MTFPFRFSNQKLIMKTIDDFLCASFDKKCDVITLNSHFIIGRKLGDCKVYLYHSGSFFIEVYYSIEYKKVLMINAFNDFLSLEPYLETISLADLKL